MRLFSPYLSPIPVGMEKGWRLALFFSPFYIKPQEIKQEMCHDSGHDKTGKASHIIEVIDFIDIS